MAKRHKKILIIENEHSALQALVVQLILEGFKVFEKEGEKNGLKFALKHHPDLILIDIFIPKTNGISILKKLRADDWGSDAPVIILANLSDAETVAAALENKVYTFLVRTDWNFEELVNKIKKRLEMTKIFS